MKSAWTLEKYGELCQAVLTAGYAVQTVCEFLEQPVKPTVVMRHDVDRFPTNALEMARLERDLGISATYYVRQVRNVFRPDLLVTLDELGHEVGYHYEVLAKTRGDVDAALALFEAEVCEFRRWAPIRTAAMHGSPLSPWNNLLIWQQRPPADFGLRGEPYLDIDYTRVAYFTDTGRAWDASATNLRDRVDSGGTRFPRVHSTDELIALLNRGELSEICIQTHPERWSISGRTLVRSVLMDHGAGVAKRLLGALSSR